MPRLLLLNLLLLASGLASADDLRQQVPPTALPAILAQLQDNPHPRFAVLDYARHSSEPRFLLFDRRTHALLAGYRSAHGQGSDPDHDGYADRFSDQQSSHASSLGTFITDQTYHSDEPGHGLSMRLRGLSASNRNAERRAIVLHANLYMERDFIRRHGVAGRSHGCLVLADADRDQVIRALQGGALIFALDSRQPNHDYLATQ